VSGHLALYVPDEEACDVKPDPASLRVEPLHHHLGFCHGLSAAVAGLPIARAAPGARDGGVRQAAVGELSLNQETKEGLLHDGLPECSDSVREQLPECLIYPVGRHRPHEVCITTVMS
jgi:hypothetical protein